MATRLFPVVAGIALIVIGAPSAFACGGLIAPDGAVNLVRTTTMAGYKDGIEHYVTSFEFAGGGGKFGSIVPLPGIPSKVIKGGDWTLQRLVQEVQPVQELALDAAAGTAFRSTAKVILEVRIDALDITVLKGGGDEVGRWAKDNGFQLPPDAPEVLDFYAERSPIFMAARFDVDEARARNLDLGDGTPVHLVIPTPNPWVPLRILGLGADPAEKIEADVFLLTERRPALLPSPSLKPGLDLEVSRPASDSLLFDLRSDRGMKWVPLRGMWLTYIKIDTPAGELVHDLAIDVSGAGVPSPVAAGLLPPVPDIDIDTAARESLWLWLVAAVIGLLLLASANRAIRTR